MQSADKTTIKPKVMHVYVSTTVLANDIQILRFISYRDRERECQIWRQQQTFHFA